MSATVDQDGMLLPDLAAAMGSKFAGLLARLAGRVGVERGELPGVAYVITADALEDFDSDRGEFAGRWVHKCRRHFARLGGGVAGGAEADHEAAGGDDPALMFEAAQALAGLEAVGLIAAALRPASASARTERRHAERLRGAARRFGKGDQGELF